MLFRGQDNSLPMRFSAELRIKMQPRDITKSCTRGYYRRVKVPDTRLLRLLLFAAGLTSFSSLANGEAVHDGNRIHRLSNPDKPEVPMELLDIVEAFIAAGEKGDPAARG